ncbi:hypothetical protein [Phycicoccus avicenniae]|uniref:hypothetical protein n=1 Tax=Phycicoccus avicenniae TaxID=2828860 RepID=UPI003D2ACA0A
MTTAPAGSRATLDEVIGRPRGVVGLIDRLARGRGVGRRGVLVGAAVAGSALVTDPKAYALRPQTAYATICGPANTASSGWSIFCATVNKGLNACPPGSFTAGWWKAADSSWCGGGYRYIVDCNATCKSCTSGCSDHLCDSRCWSCSCSTGSTATCDQRRNCCNAFRYGQCNTQIACSGGVHCRVVSCVPPYRWASCSTTSFRSDSTAEHSSAYLPAWGPLEKLYASMGAQGSFLGASLGPIRPAADGVGRYIAFKGGRIWYTKASGAVAMSTFADAAYAKAGGPAALGYPKGARINGLPGTGWLHVTQKGGLVYTPGTGAWAVTGARWTLWVATKREKGVLGYPTAAVEVRADRSWIQLFQKGCITNSTATPPAVVYGPRWTTWTALNRGTGVLGYPVADVQPLYTGAWIQRFQRGCITDGPRTTPTTVLGAMWVAWQQVGREGGVLAFPSAPVADVPGGTSQTFERGGIWARTGGAGYAVHGAVLDQWSAAGGAGGRYGFPLAHVVANADGTSTGVFEGGTITA